MKIGDGQKRLRTAAAVAVWMTLLALSQEVAATRGRRPRWHRCRVNRRWLIVQQDTGAITLITLAVLLLIGVLNVSERALWQSPQRLTRVDCARGQGLNTP